MTRIVAGCESHQEAKEKYAKYMLIIHLFIFTEINCEVYNENKSEIGNNIRYLSSYLTLRYYKEIMAIF